MAPPTLSPTSSQLHKAPSPRVKMKEAVSPRVKMKESSYVPTHSLLQHSKLPKNSRFNNALNHRYPLRSRFKSTATNFKHLAAQHLHAEQFFCHSVQHIFKPDGKKEKIENLLQGPTKDIWKISLSNEWGRLAQGNKYGVTSTDTIEFIYHHEVPIDRDITYATFVLGYRPLKAEPHRVRITCGGDKLSYPLDAGSPAADMLETKILINSTISDAHKGARFMSTDIKDFFLASPMQTPEYMRVKYDKFPEDIKERYNLQDKVTKNNYVYIKIKKGMYGLKQAAILAYTQLKSCLEPFGYRPVPGTVGLWKHESKPITFCLCVDDFGIKYFHREDVEHLLHAIGQTFQYTTDWEGKNYCGLTLDWHYNKGYVDISMPGYVEKALQRLQYKQKINPQYSPHTHTAIQYGKKGERQYTNTPDESPFLNPKETTYIQSATGSFLYYARAIDSTMLPALNEIASAQAQPTQKTKQKLQRLLDYANTYKNAYLRYYASDMILHVDSDAAYLVAPKSRSRIAGYYHLSDHPSKRKHPTLNSAILVECKTLRHVVSSAAEVETGGVYHNATTSIPIRTILHALNHPQPPTPIKTDNSTTTGFMGYEILLVERQKRTATI